MNSSSRRQLTFEQAQAIRQAQAENPRLTQADLATRFHTTQSSVSRILAGRLFPEERDRKLTEEQVQDVRYIGAGSITNAATKYGLTKSEAAAIVQGRSYRDVPLSEREIERRILFFGLEAELAALPSI